jgi:hypothetical protein
MLGVMLLCLISWLLIPRPRAAHVGTFGALAIIGFITEMVGFCCVMNGFRPYYIYNAYALLELLLIMGIVAQVDRGMRTSAMLVAALGTFGMVANAMVDRVLGPILFEGVLFISVLQALVLLVMLWRMAMGSDQALPKVPEFWLFMGLLVYFGGMAPFFALIRFVYANDPVVANVLWTLMPVLCIIRYAMGAWSCVLKRRELLRSVHG